MIKVLAIDDNKDNLIVIKALLSDALPDTVIITVQSGIDGLKAAQSENPDVILLDLVMPVMDGFETCKRLKEDENLRRIPVIILTALKTDAESRIKILKLGAEAFLSKPIEEAELVAQVNSMIRMKKSEDFVRLENQRLEKLVQERTHELEEELEQRNEIEKKLIESENRYRNIFQNSQAIMLLINPENGNIADANRAACNFYGYTREDLLKLIITDINILQQDELLYMLQEVVESTNYHNYFKHKLSNGQIRDVEVYSCSILDQGKAFLFSIIHDITERKKAEDELRKHWRAVEQSPSAIMITDVYGNIEYCNPKSWEMTGYSNEELLGKNLSILKSKEVSSETYKEICNTITAGGEWHGEFHNKKKNGELYWESTSVSAIVNPEGKITNLLSIKDDISKQKEFIIELKEAKQKAEENDRLKTTFLANISHEIRTPMNGILGFAELLKTPLLSNEEQNTFIHIIEQSGKRMLNIINDIVDISKIEAGQMNINFQEVNLNQLLKDLQTFFMPEIESKGLSLIYTTELPDQECTINTDHGKLTQILANLLKNAIKFTKKGLIEYGYFIKGEMIEFYVKDSGAGIAPDQKEIIFERFRQGSILLTRNYEGAGLGLSISKAFVEMLEGKIWLESELGQGATFFFTIPFEIKCFRSTEDIETIDTIENLPPISILIAEDDENSRFFLGEILKDKNITLIFANNGQEAFEIIRKDEKIDIILMDMKMPVMDGVEATQKIKLLQPNIPIIAQTAYAFVDDEAKARAAGCDEYISKPIKRECLLSLINQLIKNRN